MKDGHPLAAVAREQSPPVNEERGSERCSDRGASGGTWFSPMLPDQPTSQREALMVESQSDLSGEDQEPRPDQVEPEPLPLSDNDLEAAAGGFWIVSPGRKSMSPVTPPARLV